MDMSQESSYDLRLLWTIDNDGFKTFIRLG